MDTLHSIGGIAAVFNGIIAGFVLGWNLRPVLKRKKTVAPQTSRLPDIIVVELRRCDDGVSAPTSAPDGEEPSAEPGGRQTDRNHPGEDADDNA